MSKIILSIEHGLRLREVWLVKKTHHEALEAVANELVNMGLVRPASDDPMQREWEDVKARVAALEAYINGDEPGVPPNVRPPDPHAAAKDRAKLWGVELVETRFGEWKFVAPKSFWGALESWRPLAGDPKNLGSGFQSPDEAWSNFPTVPPPGWEAPKPRTDADRLGEVVWNALKSPYSKSWSELVEHVKDSYCEAALAVRKAVLAAQLEPSEEEIDKACNAYEPHYAASTPSFVESVRRGVTAALTAAARVRLEKAEGEV